MNGKVYRGTGWRVRLRRAFARPQKPVRRSVAPDGGGGQAVANQLGQLGVLPFTVLTPYVRLPDIDTGEVPKYTRPPRNDTRAMGLPDPTLRRVTRGDISHWEER